MAVESEREGRPERTRKTEISEHADSPAELIAKSGLFHPTWYRQIYMPPDTELSEVEHYMRFGVRAGAPPSPLFDVDYYAMAHEEINFRKVNPVTHYLETPVEGRANTHPLFDRTHYAQAGDKIPPEIDPFFHFLAIGHASGRQPHPLFDPRFYLASNPAVANLTKLALAHFILYGYREGRDPHPLFSINWYLDAHPDAAGWGNPLIHYLQIGAAQGYSPHPLFDPAWYWSQTDDPRARANPLAHYLTDGSAAGLSPHALFYPSWYRRTQLPEEDAASEPLCHFLLKGGRAGLDPNPLFSTSWYLAQNPDVESADMVALMHYVLHGAAENRDPHPAFSVAAFRRRNPNYAGENKSPLAFALEVDRPGSGKPVFISLSVPRPAAPRALPAAPPTAPTPAVSEIPAAHRQLANVVTSLSDDEAARRIVGYFRVIDALELGPSASTLSRREKLKVLLERVQLLAKEADDSRPVEASIVIPVYNKIEYTIACVISLLEHKTQSRFEILIGNDRSTDETREFFDAVGSNLKCITPPKNGGFIRNCNLSAMSAVGKYVVMLNNDTLILDRWLDELIAPFERFENVGLTGSKLLNADGSLQEAGGIIWRDGSGWNFGRNQDQSLPEFNYVKDVDYISGASIAILKSLWDEGGGFNEMYLPAYCEDSDMAFTLRSKGYRTLYVPGSALIHHEGVSHGKDVSTGIKAYQVENTRKMVAKWENVLNDEHYPNAEHVFVARDKSRRKPHILVVDHYIPQFDKDAGSRTLFEYCRMFVDAGFQVSFWPDNLYYDRPYALALQELGVEVLYGPKLVNQFGKWIEANGQYLNYVFLSRAHVSERYIADIKKHFKGKILFYGHDLHFSRLQREYERTRNEALLSEIETWRKSELGIWRDCDVIYYPADDERDFVAAQVPNKVARILSIYIYPDHEIEEARQRIAKEQSGIPTIMLVAGFRHRPNVDAALWLAREIVPRIKSLVPDLSTVIAGSFPPPEVTSLANDDLIVTGYISDALLRRLYLTASVIVAPLRFGGGVKGKIIEALRFGVPVATTPQGAQGMIGGEEYLEVSDSPEAFAQGVVRLLRDPKLRRQRALRGLDYIDKMYSYRAVVTDMARDIPELAVLLTGKGTFKRRELPAATRSSQPNVRVAQQSKPATKRASR
jgi:GT2 family glycosyltransferase